MKHLTLFMIVIVLYGTSDAQQFISPCPSLFTYDANGVVGDRWSGTIKIKTTDEYRSVWLRIKFDGDVLEMGTSFGTVTNLSPVWFIIARPYYKINAGETLEIRIFARFNTNGTTPTLSRMELNSQTICPDDDNRTGNNITTTFRTKNITTTTTTTTTTTEKSQIFGSDFNPASRPGFLPSRDPFTGISSRYPCGTVAAQPSPLITHGDATWEGQWPWHAALYNPKGIDLQYICGASLITMMHVLTASHCVAKRSSNAPVNAADIEVYLGKFLLQTFTNNGIQNKKVSQILIHPEYNHRFYANDIAIVKLSTPVEYTDYVRPVCLWSEQTDLNNIVDKEGTVVGWGYDHTGKLTEKLTKANMPVVSHLTCIKSYPDFFAKFADDATTLCAGFRNGTSVCNGDSGGGLVFPKQNSNRNQAVWQIRGVVSLSVALQSELVCDTSHYAIFTDSAKYLDWIKQNVIS